MNLQTKQILVDFQIVQEKPERRMGRSCCPSCGPGKNTFIIDQDRWFLIRLCLKCAGEQEFKIDFSKTEKCVSCGEIFIPIKSKTCPVCWVKKFEEEKKNGCK